MTKADQVAMLENGMKVANLTITRLRAALVVARQDLIATAEAGCRRLEDHGVKVDPPERTYAPAVARIDVAMGAACAR